MFNILKPNFLFLVCILWWNVTGGHRPKPPDRPSRPAIPANDVIFRGQFLPLIVRTALVPLHKSSFPRTWRKLGEDSVKYYKKREQLYGHYYLEDVTRMRQHSRLPRYYVKFLMGQKGDPTIWNCVSFVYVESIGNVVDAAHCKCRNDSDAYRFYDVENCYDGAETNTMSEVMVVEDPAKQERLATLGVFHYFKEEVPIDFMTVTVDEAARVISDSRSVYGFKSRATFKNGTTFACVTVAYIGLSEEGFYTNMSNCQKSLLHLLVEHSMKDILDIDDPIDSYQVVIDMTSVVVKVLDLINLRYQYIIKFLLRDTRTKHTWHCESAVVTNPVAVSAANCGDLFKSCGVEFGQGLYDPQKVEIIEATLFEQNLAFKAASMYSPLVEFKEKSIKIFEVVKDGISGDVTSRSVLKFRVADLSGLWYDCLTVAVYDSNYNRSDVTVVDCRHGDYTGRGIFPANEFLMKNNVNKRFAYVVKGEYKSVDRSKMYGSFEFVADRCLNYYVKKEKLGDRHLVMDVKELLIKDVYNGTHYQYFVSFLMKNKLSGKIQSCVATTYAGPETVRGLLVNAAHCKGKNDSDAYRFEDVVILDAPNEYKATHPDGKIVPLNNASLDQVSVDITNKGPVQISRYKKQKLGKIVPLNRAKSEIVEITHFENDLALRALIWVTIDKNSKFDKLPVVKKAQREFIQGRYRYRLHFDAIAPNKTEYDCDATGFASKTFRKYGIDYAICETGKRESDLNSSKNLLESPISERSFRIRQARRSAEQDLWEILANESLVYYKQRQPKKGRFLYDLKAVTSVHRKNIYGTTQYQFLTRFKLQASTRSNPMHVNRETSAKRKGENFLNCKSSAFYSRKYCTIIINAVHCECRNDGDATRFRDRQNCKTTTTKSTTTPKTTKTRRKKPSKKDRDGKWPRPSTQNPIAGTVQGLVALLAFFRATQGTIFTSVTSHFGNSDSTSGLPDVSVVTYYETAPNSTMYYCTTTGKFSDNVFERIDTDCSYASEDDYLPYENVRYESITKDKFTDFAWNRNDGLLQRIVTRSVDYYIEKEQLDDTFQTGQATDYKRRSLFAGILYQYYVNFQILNTETADVHNCTSSVYDLKNSTYARPVLLVSAAHCDCRNDSDFYRFPDVVKQCGFRVTFNESAETPDDYVPSVRKEIVEPTLFEVGVAKAGVRWRWARKGVDYNGLVVDVKQAERAYVSYYGDHYEYTIKAYVIAQNGTLFECVLLANANLNCIDYLVVGIDCRFDGHRGDGLVDPEDFLISKDIKYDAIVRDEFSLVNDDSLLEKLSEESVKYYRKRELLVNSYQVIRRGPLFRKTIYCGTQYQYFISFDLAVVKTISYHCSSSAFSRPGGQEMLINAAHCDCIKDIDRYRFYLNNTTDCSTKQGLDVSIVEVSTFEVKLAKQAASHYSLDAPKLFIIEVIEAIRLRYRDDYGYKLKFQMTSQDAMLLCNGKGSVSFDYRNSTIEVVKCRNINASELHNWQDYFTFGNVRFDVIDESEFTQVNETSSTVQKLLKESVVYYVRLEGFAASKGIRITNLYRKTTYKETQYQYFVRFLMETTITMQEVGCSSSVFVAIDSEEMIVGAVHCDCKPDFNAYRFNQSDDICFNEIEELILPTVRREVVEITAFELQLGEEASYRYMNVYYTSIVIRHATRVLHENAYFYKIRMKVTYPFTMDYDCITLVKATVNFSNYNLSFTNCRSHDNFASAFALYDRQDYLTSMKKSFDVITESEFSPVGVGLLGDSKLLRIRSDIVRHYRTKQGNRYVLVGIKDVYRKSMYNGTQYQYLFNVDMLNIDTDDWSVCIASVYSQLNHKRILTNAVHCNCQNDIDAYRFNYSCKGVVITYTTVAPTKISNVSSIEPQLNEMTLARLAARTYFSIRNREIISIFWIDIKQALRKPLESLYKYKLTFEMITPNDLRYECIALGHVDNEYTDYRIDIVDCMSRDDWFPGKGLIFKGDYNSTAAYADEIISETSENANPEMRPTSKLYRFRSMQHYYYRENMENDYYFYTKAPTQIYRTVMRETRQDLYTIYFVMMKSAPDEALNCTSSIFTRRFDPDNFMVSSVRCVRTNDTESYRRENESHISTLISTIDLPRADKEGPTVVEPQAHEMKLVEMAAERYFSVNNASSFWFHIVEDVRQGLKFETGTYYRHQIKFQAKSSNGSLYDCFTEGHIGVNYNNYTSNVVVCGINWYPEDEKRFSDSKKQFSEITKNGTIVQHLSRGESYSKESVKHYKNKEQLNGDYVLENITEIRETNMSETKQYHYVISFTMRKDGRELLNCTSSVLTDHDHSVTMVSAVHCSCRNDSHAYRFDDIDECREIHSMENNLAKLATMKRFLMEPNGIEQFRIDLQRATLNNGEGQHKYTLHFLVTSPNKTMFNCVSFPLKTLDMNTSVIDNVTCSVHDDAEQNTHDIAHRLDTFETNSSLFNIQSLIHHIRDGHVTYYLRYQTTPPNGTLFNCVSVVNVTLNPTTYYIVNANCSANTTLMQRIRNTEY